MISRKYICAILVVIAFAATGSLCAERPMMQIRVSVDDVAAMRALYAEGFDVVWVEEDFVELLTDAGGSLKVSSAKGVVKEVMDISGFGNFLDIYDSEGDAINNF